MKSKIYMADVVENKNRKFGAYSTYIYCDIIMENGDVVPGLFTNTSIDNSIIRASKNKEDIPSSKKPWWKIFGN